jgi:hypothetical protein
MVYYVKIFLIQNHLFKHCTRGKAIMDLLTFQLHLSRIERLANSRPLFIHKNLILSVSDIPICSQLVAPHVGASGLTTKDGASADEADIFSKRLDEIQKQTNNLMVDLAHHLSPRLLETESAHSNNKDGPENSFMGVGDIVLDRRQLVRSGNITGSLGKIVLMSEDNRWCLLHRVKSSVLDKEAKALCLAIKRGQKLERPQIKKALLTVGRQLTDLHLVARHSSLEKQPYITFNQGSRVFDWSLCLTQIGSKQHYPHCLPPDSAPHLSNDAKDVFVQTPEQWIIDNKDLLNDSASGDPTTWAPDDVQTASYTPDSNDEERSEDDIKGLGTGEELPVRTKQGRISRKPQRYGY